jgi:hypothetical protein
VVGVTGSSASLTGRSDGVEGVVPVGALFGVVVQALEKSPPCAMRLPTL